MDKAKRAACHRCRSKHLKCNGAWPTCGRCQSLRLHCRYQAPNRFVHWAEHKFPANHIWVGSPARKFCVDKSVPEAGWRSLAGLLDGGEDAPLDEYDEERDGSAVSIDSEHHYSLMTREPCGGLPTLKGIANSTVRDHSDPHPWAPTDSQYDGDSSKRRQRQFSDNSTLDPSPDDFTKGRHVPSDSDLSLEHGRMTSPWDRLSESERSSNKGRSTRVEDHLSNLSQSLLQYFDIPSITQMQQGVDRITSPDSIAPPTTTPKTAGPREFPLTNFIEAYLFKYWIDQVAPWLDIADPDRYFELVVPIITRSNPPLLCAVFALSAQHLLFAPGGPEDRSRPCYRDLVRARLSKLSVIEFVLECLQALRSYDSSPESERPCLFTALVLLRQVELIDRDCAPSDRCFQVPSHQAGSHDTFLSIMNSVVRKPDFGALMHQSGLVQAAYMLTLRQEMYYAMASGRPPAIAVAVCPPFHPFSYEMTTAMIRVLEDCCGNVNEARPSTASLDRLMQRQNDLNNGILLGIRPIFQQNTTDSVVTLRPTIWYASKTEVYLVQLSKMAQAVLISFGARLDIKSGSSLGVASAAEAVSDLLRDTYAIACGRSESPHALFHANIISRMLKNTPRGHEQNQILEESTERMKNMKIWPFKFVLDIHWKDDSTASRCRTEGL